MTKQHIVVIGAGFAGITAVRTLSKKLKETAEITLIDKHSYHTMMTQLHEIASGRVEPEAGQYDLQKLLGKRKNVQLVTDTVCEIDKEKKIVKTATGQYPFDYVIVAMGAEANDFNVPGVREHGFTLWSMEEAIRIRRHIEKIVELGAVEPDDNKRKAMLSFTVAGSGFTGIEMIGEMIDLKEILARKHKLDPREITLNLVEMLPTILNTLPRSDADKALKYLEKKGVNVLVNHAITEVAKDHIKIKGGEELPTHTLIWTTGIQGNTEAKVCGLKEAERGHRLVANEYMEAVGFEGKGIFVAGDLSTYTDPQTGNTTPQIVEAAEQTGHTAAENIIAAINGTSKHPFVGKYQGTLVSIGSKWGVAYLMNTLHLSGFWAMLMKHLVYMLYCFQIRSGYYLFQYLKNEFFHTPDMRNIGYGHISRRGNVLWSVPLRVFYGLVWLVEASHKIVGEGNYLKPNTWFGKGSWFTNHVNFPFSWLQEPVAGKLADATSGASQGAAAAAKPVFGLSYAYGDQPMAVFEKMPKFIEPVIKFMIPNKEVALFLQKFMSILELFIALALIFGLFTFIASGTTAGLTVMFCLSGMFYWVNLWFIFVAIALMNGSGRSFGLDRYVQPWIQKRLGKWWYGMSHARYRIK